MKIQILVDNQGSWIIPFAEKLNQFIIDKSYECDLIFKHEEVVKGEILFLLSCEKKFKYLELNKYNLVVHESDLPKGKGWSPLTWQVIEGFKKIPITLFEAKEEIDSGDIFLQDYIELEGTELINDIRRLQGEMTIKLCLEFIKQYDNITGRDQSGESTYYRKRLSQDSELDINRSIKDQFNLLRVVDNERYPAFFVLNEKKYIIKIYKSEEIEHKSKEEQR